MCYTKLCSWVFLHHCPVFDPIHTLSKTGWRQRPKNILHYSLVLSVNQGKMKYSFQPGIPDQDNSI